MASLVRPCSRSNGQAPSRCCPCSWPGSLAIKLDSVDGEEEDEDEEWEEGEDTEEAGEKGEDSDSDDDDDDAEDADEDALEETLSLLFETFTASLLRLTLGLL